VKVLDDVFGMVWDEVYGLEVGGRLFRIWAQYNRHTKQEPGYRAAIRAILSSLSVRG
jgi:hypothetical protein